MSNYEILGGTVNYAALYNPQGLEQFCKAHGRYPNSYDQAVHDAVAIISEGGDEALLDFYHNVHPDAGIYNRIMDGRIAHAPEHKISRKLSMPTSKLGLELYYVPLKDILMLVIIALIVYLIVKN